MSTGSEYFPALYRHFRKEVDEGGRQPDEVLDEMLLCFRMFIVDALVDVDPDRRLPLIRGMAEPEGDTLHSVECAEASLARARHAREIEATVTTASSGSVVSLSRVLRTRRS